MKNSVSLIGRIGKEIKTSELGEGKKVTNFSLATSQYYRDNGEKKENTQWHRCVLWNNENILPYLTTGNLIAIDGSIKYGTFEKEVGDETVTIPTIEIVIDSVVLLPGKKD